MNTFLNRPGVAPALAIVLAAISGSAAAPVFAESTSTATTETQTTVKATVPPSDDSDDEPGTAVKPIKPAPPEDNGTASTGTRKPPPASSPRPSTASPGIPLPPLTAAPTLQTTQPFAVFDLTVNGAADSAMGTAAADELVRQLGQAGLEVKSRRQLQDAFAAKTAGATTSEAATPLARQRTLAVATGAGSMFIGFITSGSRSHRGALVRVELRQLNPATGAVLNTATASVSLPTTSGRASGGDVLPQAVKDAIAADISMMLRTRK